MQAMAHDAAAVSVRQERKVGSPVDDVGNIGHNQFSRTFGYELGLRIQEVFISVEPVSRIGCLRTETPLPEHQVIGSEQPAKPVPSDRELLSEVLLTENEQLSKARLGQVFSTPEILTIQDYARMQDVRFVPSQFARIAFVKSLMAKARGSAQRGETGCCFSPSDKRPTTWLRSFF